MSHFTKQFTKRYDFDGDIVTVTMRRLKRKAAVKIAPFLPEPDEEGKYTMNAEEGFTFMDKAGDILSDYIVEFSGLNDEDNVPIPKEDLFGDEAEAYFMTLLGEMMSDLMEASFVKPKDKKGRESEEVKKSEGQSENVLEDSAESLPDLTSEE